MLAGKVLKLLAKAAAPKLKKIGAQLLKTGISTGMQAVSDQITRKTSDTNANSLHKIKPLTPELSSPPSPPSPTATSKDEDDDYDDLEALLERSRQLRANGKKTSS